MDLELVAAHGLRKPSRLEPLDLARRKVADPERAHESVCDGVLEHAPHSFDLARHIPEALSGGHGKLGRLVHQRVGPMLRG